ncbi:MAG: IS200/IS605 family transposase [Isosphaeraceae bacterium]
MASTLTHLVFHVVFSTKGRMPLIDSSLRTELDAFVGGIVRNLGGSLIAIGGMPDHTHLLVKLRAETSVAELVRVVKANSSRWVHGRHPKYQGFAWQAGYGAFSVSGSQVEVVRRYVRSQEDHHRTMSFLDEYRAFLKRHEIAFDERYLVD